MATEINIGAFLGTRAFLNPGKEALYDVVSDRRFTFRELNERTNQLARALRRAGLGEGDGLAIVCANRPEFGEAVHAALRTGLRFTPVNWHLTPKEMAYIIDDCEAKAIVGDARFGIQRRGVLRRDLHDHAICATVRLGDERRAFPDAQAVPEIRDILRPFPASAMRAFPVSDRVNSVQHDDPECIRPAPEPLELDLFS